MKYKNNLLKIMREEYEKKFHDYRDINKEKMDKCVSKELSELPIIINFYEIKFA